MLSSVTLDARVSSSGRNSTAPKDCTTAAETALQGELGLSTGLYPTNNLYMNDLDRVDQTHRGRLLVSCACGLALLMTLESIVGSILAASYFPTAAGAHASVARMHEAGILQSFHYWASALSIVVGFCLLVVGTWLGWYKSSNRGPYVASAAMFFLAMAFQVTGNVLPFDRHGVQTAAIESGIAARMPIVGRATSKLMLAGDQFGESTLQLWYKAHSLLLPTLFVLVVILLAYPLVRNRRTLSAVGVALPTVVGLVLALLVRSPFGTAATPADYTDFSARVSWYTWPMHGLLHMFDSLRPGLGWIGAGIIPGLFVVFVFSLPLWPRKVGVAPGRIGLGAFLALFFVAGAVFAGSSASLIGTRDPAEPVRVVQSSTGQAKIDPALVSRGKQLINSVGCSDCHGADGLQGGAGPSLKEVWKQHSDAQFYEGYIRKPTSVSPDSTMPAFADLKQQDLQALAEYLRSPK